MLIKNKNTSTAIILIYTVFQFFAYSCNTNKVPRSEKNSNKSLNDGKNAVTLLEKGIHEYQQGNFDSADNLLKKSIMYAENTENKLLLLKGYNNLGNIQADKGNNTAALSFYQQALNIAEQLNDLKYMAHINKNIGALYVSWKRFDESLKYYYTAEKTAIDYNDSLLYADCNNNIGTVLEQKQKYDKAIKRYNTALEVYDKYGVVDRFSMIYSNIAIAYKLKKDYRKAILYNKKSLEISREIGDKWEQAATLNNIGNLYGEMGNYKQAKIFCEQSLILSQEINAPEIIYNVYESLADAAYKVKDYENALKYQKCFNEEKDKFNNIEANRHLSELTVKYETEKKEKENILLKLENKAKGYETEQTKKEKHFILVTSVFLLCAIIMFFRFLQRNLKNRQIIEQQFLANKISFETEQVERARIARDLHDSVGQKLAVVKMQLSMTFQNDAHTSGLLDEAIQEVRSISHNLLSPNLENGLAEALENLRDEFNYNSVQPKMLLSFSDNVLHLQLSESVSLAIFRIIQEFISNTVKYAAAEKIHISMDRRNNNLHLTLHDDGLGFDLAKELRTSGIGLKNVTERIKQVNGNISMKTIGGTTFEMVIPL